MEHLTPPLHAFIRVAAGRGLPHKHSSCLIRMLHLSMPRAAMLFQKGKGEEDRDGEERAHIAVKLPLITSIFCDMWLHGFTLSTHALSVMWMNEWAGPTGGTEHVCCRHLGRSASFTGRSAGRDPTLCICPPSPHLLAERLSCTHSTLWTRWYSIFKFI